MGKRRIPDPFGYIGVTQLISLLGVGFSLWITLFKSRVAQSKRKRLSSGQVEELTMSFGPPKSPKNVFIELAEACARRYLIRQADMYGVTPPTPQNPSRADLTTAGILTQKGQGKEAPAKEQEVGWLEAFEAKVAAYVGKKAGVFIPSGTMTQQIVLCMARER